MPIFEYICRDCKLKTEELVLHNEENPECPECGEQMEKKMSTFNTHFKGTGFYETDYKKKEHGSIPDDEFTTIDDDAELSEQGSITVDDESGITYIDDGDIVL